MASGYRRGGRRRRLGQRGARRRRAPPVGQGKISGGRRPAKRKKRSFTDGITSASFFFLEVAEEDLPRVVDTFFFCLDLKLREVGLTLSSLLLEVITCNF